MQLKKRLSDLKTKAKAYKNVVEVHSQIAKIQEDIKNLLEGTRYEVLYDYVKRQDDELSLIKGDIILYPTLTDDDDWMKGYIEKTGEQGLFPLIYVCRVM